MEAQVESESLVKILTDGAVTTFSGNLFQYLGIRTENADLLLARRKLQLRN